MSFTSWQPPPTGDFPQFDPSQEDLTRQYGVYPSELESKPEGYRASPADAPQKLQEQGWWKCPTQKDTHGKPCDFWLNPQAHQAIKNNSGYVSCPKCKISHDLLRDEVPWHGAETESDYNEPGGGTHVGIPMTDLGQIAENLVADLGEIPGYGRITSWHPGGAGMQSALDGTTDGWGVEVKGLSMDAASHTFDPSRQNRQNPRHYYEKANEAAQELGLQGVLGVLVMLDFRRDVADIYAKPMPLSGWQSKRGPRYGVAAFHKDTAERLVAEVPFKSPYKDPNNPSPGPFSMDQYYEQPPVQMPPGMEPQPQQPASDDWLHTSARDDDPYPRWYQGPGTYSGINYDPNWGGYHKGTIDENGQVHVWPVKPGGFPHHDEIGIAPINDDALADFTIDNEKVYGVESDEYPERYRPIVYSAIRPKIRFYRPRIGKWEHDQISPGQINDLRHAAERAWGDDTRHGGFVGHPDPSQGHCFVTSQWLAHKLGGHVGMKNGHYFWVSPDRSHIMDLTGDWFSHPPSDPSIAGQVEHELDEPGTMDSRLNNWRPGPAMYKRADHPMWKGFRIMDDYPEHPRAKLFERRANATLKTADLAGPTPYTGETPQQQEDWNFSAPLIHDEPHWDVASGDHRYQWIMANNHVQVSPIHSMDEMANHAQFDTSSSGPFAAGFVDVKDGHATWSVSTNMSLHSLSNMLEKHSETVGWKFDGLVDPQGQEIDDNFGARKSMWYTERKDGHLVMSESPLPHGKRIDIRGKTAHIRELTEGLQEWANDFGYRLSEYPGGGDATDLIKTREHLDMFDRGDMKFQPERDNPDLDIEHADLTCSKCGQPFDSMAALRLHHRDHEPHEEEVDQNKFPWPHDFDDPLGFGTEPVPQMAWDGVTSMVLPNQKIAERYPRFNQQGWDVSDANLRYYGAYHRGQVIGYAAVNPYGYIAALDALRPEATQSILRLIQSHYEEGLIMPWNNSQRTLLARLGMVCQGDGMWKWAKGQEPKDLIEAPIPFVYDVKGTKEHQMGMISLGYPGQSTHEVMPRGGEKFTPGGVVEGLYQPGGKVLFISHTNVPYTTRQFAQLWYALYPQMELTSVEHQMPDGSTQKLAAESVGSYLKTLVSSDQAAYGAYQALRAAGGKLYVVGGAIRDALQQRQPKDLDLMVAGIPTEQVAHVLDSLPGSVDLTGKRFGVYRYRTNGQEVEIALPREDKYETARRGLGAITVDHNLPVEQDLARRDFTINSMAVDLDNGQLIDPHNGAKDLGNNRLKTTHEDSFREDPTRLVRALTAHSRFGVHPDEHTRQAMAKDAHLLRHESPDALNQTLDKLFTSEHPASGIRLAKETGVLNHLFPEVANQWHFDQNNSHHAQQLGDHLNNVLDRVSRQTTDPDIRMAALLHDIGKPASEWRDENGTSHYYQNEKGEGAYHEIVGAKMAEDRMRALNYPVARINRVKSLIQDHMWPAFNSPKGARRFLRNYGQHADDLLTLRDADMYGKGYEPSVVEETRTPVAQMRELVDQSRKGQEPTDLQNMFVNGNDLIALGMQPGPQMGVVLRQLLDHVVENPQDNTRDRLLQLAKGYAAALPE